MDTYSVYKPLPRGRAIIKGELKDLYPDTPIIIKYGEAEFDAVVETRTSDGAVVRVVMGS